MISLEKKIKLYLLILKMLDNIKEEYIKCIKDPYYFYTKYCVVKDKKTNKIINVKISRNQYERFIKYKITSNFR